MSRDTAPHSLPAHHARDHQREHGRAVGRGPDVFFCLVGPSYKEVAAKGYNVEKIADWINTHK